MNNALFPDSTVNLRSGMERKFSIHSKGEGAIYHDISDIPVCDHFSFNLVINKQ